MNKEDLRKIVKWTAPLLGIEVLMFLIFYQFFAYLFEVLGILFTFIITFAIIYTIAKRIGALSESRY